MKANTEANDSTEPEPPFGTVEIEYTVPAAVHDAAEQAYENAVAEGYEGSFTQYLVDNTHTESECVRVDGATTGE